MNTKKILYRIFLIITFVLFSASLIIPFISVTSILAPIAMITLIPCNIIRIILQAEIVFDAEQELRYELEDKLSRRNQMSCYDEKNKLISIRVNARKYEMVKAYIEQNKYRSYPMLSFGKIFDDALDALIKEKNITEPKPIKGQCRMKF